MLQHQIFHKLSKLLEDVERGLEDCEKFVDLVGMPHTTSFVRTDLHEVGEGITYSAKAAVEVDYTDIFFVPGHRRNDGLL